MFEKEGVACLLNLTHDLFTTAATGNVEVNPSSATATSLNQHIFGENSGHSRDIPDALPSGTVLKNLPEKLTNERPGYLPPKVPMCRVN